MVLPISCRVCESTNNLQLISASGNEKILLMLQSIASLKVTMNDNLPQHICDQCTVELKETYCLRLLYAITSAKMKNLLQSARRATEFPSDLDELRDEASIIKKSDSSQSDCSLGNKKCEESGINAEVHEPDGKMTGLISKCNYEVISDEEKYVGNNNGRYLKGMSGNLQDKGGSTAEIPTVMGKPMTNLNAESNTCEKCGEVYNTKTDIICGKTISPQRKHVCQIYSRMLKSTASGSNEATNSGCEIYKPEVSGVISEIAPSFKLQEISKEGSLSEKNKNKIKKTLSGGHKSSPSISKSNKCDQCDKSFTKLKNLKKHLATHKNAIHKCEKCGKPFMKRHKCSHSNQNKCVECGKSYSVLRNLKQHMELHAYPDRYKCDECGKSFNSSQSFKLHELSHSDQNKCDICDKSFASLRYLKEHMDLHSNPDCYRCDECDKSFSSLGWFKFHLTMHLNRDGYKCDECGKSFKLAQYLKRHKLTHSNLNKCEECGKSFSRLSSLKKHCKQALHTNPDLFECDECETSFRRADSLKEHKLMHSGSVKCDECGKSFTRARNLKIHRALHLNPYCYKCDICEKSFTSPSNLRQHKVSHSNPGRNKCNECGKSFSSLKNLRIHQALHTNPEH